MRNTSSVEAQRERTAPPSKDGTRGIQAEPALPFGAGSSKAAIVLGSSVVVLTAAVLFLLTLSPDQLALLVRSLGPSALLWAGVYGILEQKLK
ncbi:MAG: hypothetical protein WAM39_13975 [Bryobacteraceae bacterium]